MTKMTVKRQLREIAVQIGGSDENFRTETFNGTEYLVVPLVMLVEGVIQGANAATPEFCPSLELEKSTPSWNGRPIVMNHPQIQGEFVSANSPSVLEGWAFGYVFNVSTESGKLKGEAWLDTARALEMGGDFQEAIERIQAGELVEVSTGLYTELVPNKGRWNNRNYSSVWKGVLPDHLAILSKGITGACSVEDGCGIPRLNKLVENASLASLASAAMAGSVTSRGHGFNGVAMRVHAEPVLQTNCSCGGTGSPAVLGSGPVGGADWNPSAIDGGIVGSGEGPARTSDMANAGIDPLLPPAGTGTGETVPVSVDTDDDAAEDYGLVSGDLNAWLSSRRPLKPADTTFTNMAQRALRDYALEVQEEIRANNIVIRGNSLPSDVVFSDVAQILGSAIRDSFELINGYIYVAEVTTDTVIICGYDDDWNSLTWQIAYSMDSDGNVVFSGDPEPVLLMTRIVKQPAMSANMGAAPMTTRAAAAPAAATTVAPPAAEATATATAAPAVNASIQTAEEFIAQAPLEMREMMSASLRLFQQARTNLINKIKGNARNKFSDQQLESFSIEVLEAMADLAYDPPAVEAVPLTGSAPRVETAPAAPVLNYGGRAAPTGDTPAAVAGGESRSGAPTPPKVFEGRPLSRFGKGAGLNTAAVRSAAA